MKIFKNNLKFVTGADVNVLSKDGKRALHFALNHFLNHPEKTNFNVLDLIYKNEPGETLKRFYITEQL